MDVASFTFEELQLNLLGNGVCVGCFEGEAHIDEDGAVTEICFYGYSQTNGKGAHATVKVPLHWRNDLDPHERFIREAANQIEADYDRRIKEVLNDWRLSLRERDHEAA